jgi:hypothetical protein
MDRKLKQPLSNVFIIRERLSNYDFYNEKIIMKGVRGDKVLLEGKII